MAISFISWERKDQGRFKVGRKEPVEYLSKSLEFLLINRAVINQKLYQRQINFS